MILLKTAISPLRWTYIFLIISILWIGTIFVLNFVVDPFGNRAWIAEKKYKPIVHERSEKYNIIFNQNNIHKYNCIILGSSRVMSITPALNGITHECYNFGVHVANNPEKLFILQEWLKRAPLKTVYIGNELYNLHAQTRPLYLNPHSFTNGSEGNYFSISTLLISLKTLTNAIKDQPQTYFKQDGSIEYYQEEKDIKEGIFDHSYSHFKDLSQETVNGNFIQNPFTYERRALEPLKQIKALCDQHHIALYPFITPTFYESQLQMQKYPFLVAASQRFRHDLVEIFGTVYDFDTNTSENRDPTNFYDPFHYRPNIGSLIINQMQHDGSYGTPLTANNFYKR